VSSHPHGCDLTIIVVAWNVKELLDECFAALRRSDDSLEKQVILVDNGSVDGTAEFIAERYPEVELVRSPANLGFIRANNLAYTRARGEYILMLNSDAFVSPGAIRETVQFMRRTPDAGVVGARLIGRDGVLQPSARQFPTPFKLFLAGLGLDGRVPFVRPLDDLRWDHRSVRRCDWVVGCYLLARRTAIETTGFFLREDFFMYNDDVDLCKRIARAGYRTYFYPVDVIHVGGANMEKMHRDPRARALMQEFQIESGMIYFRKNHGLVTVLGSAAGMLFLDLLRFAKRLLLLRFEEIIREVVPHLMTVVGVTVRTGYGTRRIH